MKFECYRNKENHSEFLVSDGSIFGLGKIHIGDFFKVLKLVSDNTLNASNGNVKGFYETSNIEVYEKKIIEDEDFNGVLYKTIRIPYSQFELVTYTIKED
jgi:hypothetical protein